MKAHLMGIAVGLVMATIGLASAGSIKDGPAQSASAQLSPAQRGAVVEQIVHRWGPFVEQVHRTSTGAWATRMQGTFAAANDGNLRRAARMNTFQGMMDALVGQHLTDNQVMDSLVTQAQVLKSGPAPALLGSATADLVYTPLAPCRIADTRLVGGPISGGTSRGFHGYTGSSFTAQGGSGSNCGIPPNPSALMLNVTVVAPTQAGYLTVFPLGTTAPLAANLNYAIGAVVGNEIAAKMTIGSATGEFSVFAAGSTNLVIDAVGYFMAPQATALDCVDVSATVNVPANFATLSANATCPNGYIVTGGGCSNGGGDIRVTEFGAFGDSPTGSFFQCQFNNASPTTVEPGTGRARCCRVPGR